MIKIVISGPGLPLPYATSTTDDKESYNNTQQGSPNWSNNYSSNVSPIMNERKQSFVYMIAIAIIVLKNHCQ